MAKLDDTTLDNLRALNILRDRAKELRERGRKALTKIPEDFTDDDYKRLSEECDLSSKDWVSGPHPIDLALLVRVLNHRDLGDSEYDSPTRLTAELANAVTDRFIVEPNDEKKNDLVPILTAARSMHALVCRPQTVFSTATMLCYYRIVRELYFAAFPNWIIGAARAGEGGRESAFVTGECVRAILAFQKAIRDTITFLNTTKRIYGELERLKAIPNLDDYLKITSGNGDSNWQRCLSIEFERIVLDWYAANDLRHNVIALDLPLPSLFPLTGQEKVNPDATEKALDDLRGTLEGAVKGAKDNIALAKQKIEELREHEQNLGKNSDTAKKRFQESGTAHDVGLRVVAAALKEAETATEAFKTHADLPTLLDCFNKQYLGIYRRIEHIIEPAKRYIQNVLDRELAQAVNSSKFDAGELLFASACFGALTKWKQNEQLAESRRLLVKLFPEDGRLQTSRPFQSNAKGLRLIPIAFEMSRSFAQLLQKDYSEDLDPIVVRKILNAFEENPIAVPASPKDGIGWNFRGAPESKKPSVWVTAIAVFALDRTVRMLNERMNAMVLRNFNVEWPRVEVDPVLGAAGTTGKLDLNDLIYPDYELQSSFTSSASYSSEYEEDPPRVDGISVAIRLQQMRAHLTRALLPDFYSKKSNDQTYKKAYSAIFYGPPGTGKTTLAEALAATSKVPLVRLSPSDLMVQGTDVIESRARAIFDSLSMLTQAVIFLDEFEPVVRARETGKTPTDSSADPPEFRFLVTGMLPKLIKLNKTAEAQSVVYCLATNFLIQVDKAAKRIGRFDLQIPIYHPDPMSRVGVFLYRLITRLQETEKGEWGKRLDELESDPNFWVRTHDAIGRTEEVSAQSLATIFFATEEKKSFFSYVLDGSPAPSPTREKSKAASKTAVEQDIEVQRSNYEKSWKNRH